MSFEEQTRIMLSNLEADLVYYKHRQTKLIAELASIEKEIESIEDGKALMREYLENVGTPKATQFQRIEISEEKFEEIFGDKKE